MRFLFVCMGNICRSPTAEAVFRAKLKERGLDGLMKCDSAGTIAHHQGEPADGRSKEHAARRGYALTSLARQIQETDFTEFDMILTMDDNNFFDVLRLAGDDPTYKAKVHKFTDFCLIHKVDKVPDPYYKGDEGFELVLDIIEDASEGLLQKVLQDQKSNKK